MNTTSISGKRILVTGASGYIGGNLVRALQSQNCFIVRASRDLSRLSEIKDYAESSDVEIDYQDKTVWENLLRGVDIVFYLAAQTSTYEANANPEKDYEHNVLPMLNLLKSCELNQFCPTVIFAGTATQVGLTENLPVTEGGPDVPLTVYDEHKLLCEKKLLQCSENGVIRSCSLRLSNVYGPGAESSRNDRGILNQMIRRALNKETLTLYGKGDKIRDYLYIDDVVQAFLLAAANSEATNGKYFNIGSGKGHSFIEVFKLIVDRVESYNGIRSHIAHIDPPEGLSKIEERNYIADIHSYSKATGWVPQVGLETGIDNTIAFFEESMDSH